MPDLPLPTRCADPHRRHPGPSRRWSVDPEHGSVGAAGLNRRRREIDATLLA